MMGLSYFGQHDPLKIQHDLADIKYNFSWINFPITEEDILFRAKGFRDRIALAKQMGFEVWVSPWGVARLFGGEGLSSIPKGMCVRSIQVKEVLDRWMDFAHSTDADAILFDEMRSCCSCDPTGVLAKMMQSSQKKNILYYSGVSEGTEKLKAFAQNLGTDLYWPNGTEQAKIDALIHPERHLWIQGFRVDDPEKIYQTIHLAQQVEYVGIWGYQNCDVMSVLECQADFWKDLSSVLSPYRSSHGD